MILLTPLRQLRLFDDSDAAKRWLHQNQFMLGSPTFKLCPTDGSRSCFAGRSNAGNHSLALIRLTQQRQLGLFLQNPGRTQMINFLIWAIWISVWWICRVWLCGRARGDEKRMAVRA